MTETFAAPLPASAGFSRDADTMTIPRPVSPEWFSMRAVPARVTTIVIPIGSTIAAPTIAFPGQGAGYSSAPQHAQEDLGSLFTRLAEEWRRDTMLHSSPVEIALHPAYQQIIGLGRKAVPFILRDLAQRGGHWFWALRAITGEDPASEQTSMREAARVWLDWGRRNAYWQ